MRKLELKAILVTSVVLLSSVLCKCDFHNTRQTTVVVENESTLKSHPAIPDDWHIFIKALIEVESEGKSSATGVSNDIGVLQITPIYVEEVNRLLGEDKYGHIDARDSIKSIEMFEVMQSSHNPNKSTKKALMLHNPNSMKANYMTHYEHKVMYNFYRMKYELLNEKINGNKR